MVNCVHHQKHCVDNDFGRVSPKSSVCPVSSLSLSMFSYVERNKRKVVAAIATLIFFIIMTFSEGDPEPFFLIFVIAYPFLMAFFLISWIFRQVRSLKQLKNESTRAELMLLKSQVNPHFFFNTLNNLYGLTVEKSDKAPEVVLKISDMMRYTIYEGKKDKVSLDDELEYLQNFIELHKMRYHKKVDIHFHHQIIGDTLQVTPLLFIILLENAFKHGVENLTQDAWVNISLIAGNDKIVFAVENNFDPNELGNQPGIGLENLKRRLELIYPEKHSLSLLSDNNVYKAQLQLDIS